MNASIENVEFVCNRTVPFTKNGLIMPKRVHFYYLWCYGKPFACVCIGKDMEGKWCRGISVCSIKDNFNKKKARLLAFVRWCKAVDDKKCEKQVIKIQEYSHHVKLLKENNLDLLVHYDCICNDKELEITKEVIRKNK